MEELKVGDMAIIVRGAGRSSNATEVVGKIVEITDPIGSMVVGNTSDYEPAYGVRDSDGIEYWAGITWLRKLPPKQKTTTWDQCAWQPNKQGVEA